MIHATDFYNSNKDIKPIFPSIPNDMESDEDITKWIFKQNIPFIDLDLKIDLAAWQKETEVAMPFLVPHRESDSEGWNSCCIHGISIDKTGVWQNYSNEEPIYSWTELSKLTPTITEFWKSLPFEKFARIRFMELEPEGYITPHSDAPGDVDLLQHLIPFNIAVIHPDNCFMTLKDHGLVPWKQGDIKLVNITNEHSVINLSNQRRIHMIGHGIIGNKFQEFCKLISQSYKKQYERNRV